MPRRHARLLIAVFLLSVLVRVPQLDRPLSKHHEFCTAVALIVMDVWWQRGFAACTACPAVTFPGRCEGESGTIAPDPMQREGVRYYISHMPLAYWAPFAVFKALCMPPGPLPLQLFNFILHGLTAFFLYRFMASLLAGTVWAVRMEDAPLFATVLYLLMPAPLWYHGNVYMSDMAVQLPWAWALAVWARMFRPERVDLRCAPWLLLAVAATSLTEWLGLFTALAFGAFALHRGIKRKDHGALMLAWAIPAVAALAMASVLWLYSDIAGADNAWAYYTDRWAERGSIVPGEGMPDISFIFGLPPHVIASWGPVVLLLISGLMLRRKASMPPAVRSAMWLITLPALVHIAVFLRYAGHEFSVLKLGFVLCALASFVLVRWHERHPAFGNIALVSACSLGIAMFTVYNRPGDGTATGDRYDIAMRHGLFIAKEARYDERIFVEGAVVEPQLLWYAKRNMDELPAGMEHELVGPGNCAEVHFIFNGDGRELVRVAIPRIGAAFAP